MKKEVVTASGFVLVSPWNLGDLVLSTPLIRALAELSGQEVRCVIHPRLGKFLSQNKYVGGVFHRDFFSPIVIEDNVWIGRGVIIMPGVVIGSGAVVGANSVVTKSIHPFSVAVGAPARIVRALTCDESC